MNTFKNLRILLAGSICWRNGTCGGRALFQYSFVSVSEAVVGRPLTPVSVAERDAHVVAMPPTYIIVSGGPYIMVQFVERVN
jgi:hypothetical protein